jgi:hypothetical protein
MSWVRPPSPAPISRTYERASQGTDRKEDRMGAPKASCDVVRDPSRCPRHARRVFGAGRPRSVVHGCYIALDGTLYRSDASDALLEIRIMADKMTGVISCFTRRLWWVRSPHRLPSFLRGYGRGSFYFFIKSQLLRFPRRKSLW